ncbi:MAG: MaoC family dehydratase N-terminal domain-containing protein [Candidatus Rokubacteria bacterium]|nr:MaoC family dehydratase N-terminal domain-containing protein [Candidatus Rokubacteria bacterium]
MSPLRGRARARGQDRRRDRARLPRRAPGLRADLRAAIVGRAAGPLAHDLDARWLMAYAAALGETDPRYYDTVSMDGPMGHPIFPVGYEWPLVVEIRAKAIEASLVTRSVHATHDVIVHRAPRAGDRLLTTARVASVSRHRAGALVVLELRTVDAAGAPATTTHFGSIYRGVGVDGETPAAPAPRSVDAGAVRWETRVEVPATAAHLYTEGARIWNPIHTDLAVARAAGLPGLILHGTATLALAVSRVVARDVGGDPRRVRRVSTRFSGMVALPSAFTVRGRARRGETVSFDAVGDDGRPILSEGALQV